MGLSANDLQVLLQAFEASTWQELVVEVDGDTLRVSRRADAAAVSSESPPRASSPNGKAKAPSTESTGEAEASVEPSEARPAEPYPDPVAGSGVAVRSPSIGLFWRSPSPGAPPFVEVGSRIAPGDTVGILEVMKLMSPVKAELSGVVTAIVAENGAMVEHDQALVLVDPAR